MPNEQTFDEPRPESRRTYGLWAGVVVLVVVALVSWFGYNSVRSQSLVDQTLREQFEWQFVPAEPDPVTPGPRTSVNIKIANVNMPLGTFAGSCSVVDGKNAALLTDELSGVVCKNSTVGVELGIFKEQNGQLTLKKGTIASGSDRGSNFTPIVKQS
jgi:hypothetical protein